MSKRVTKLALRTETLAHITDAAMSKVVGGAEVTAGAPSRACPPTQYDTCLCAGR
jgi:hypothetical protein